MNSHRHTDTEQPRNHTDPPPGAACLAGSIFGVVSERRDAILGGDQAAPGLVPCRSPSGARSRPLPGIPRSTAWHHLRALENACRPIFPAWRQPGLGGRGAGVTASMGSRRTSC